MQQLVPLVTEGEVIGPGRGVYVVAAPRPFSNQRETSWVEAGVTLAEIVAGLRSSKLARDWIVCVDGTPVPREWWARVRVKNGRVVTCRATVGDSAILRTALLTALAVAALVVAAPLAGAFVPLALQGTWMFVAAKAAISAGIIIGGTMALNSLFPVRPPEQLANEGQGISVHSIAGAQNQTSLYAPVPVVLGIHRMSPFNAAEQYTEIVGDDQYLRCLFVWGYGELEISDLKLGDTALTTFDDVEIETRVGTGSDDAITIYPADVDEEALSIELTSSVETGGTFDTLADGDIEWQERTTNAGIDEISVDFAWPTGLYGVDLQAGVLSWTSKIKMQYRETGEVTWVNVPGFGLSGVRTYTAKRRELMRRGFRWTVTRGPSYDVRVGRATRVFPGNTNLFDEIHWTAIRGFRNDAPVDFDKPIALTALRIKATGQLSGAISELNGIVGSVVASFDGTTRVSNNPADLIRHVLQTPSHANARPVPDEEIDLDNLSDFYDYCETEGWTFNQVRTERTSVESVVADIAAAGRAVYTFIDGKWGVIWDRPSDPLVQHFTPRNSWDFQGSHPYPVLPHAWRARFIDETNGYTVDERIIYDDGYSEANATLFEGIEFPGVTDPDLVWRHGRFHLAQIRLQPETLSITTGWENIICTRGDRVHVTHDAALIGLSSMRVLSVSGQDVTFDTEVEIEAAVTYGVRFRTTDPGTLLRAVNATMDPGLYTTLTLVGDLSSLAAGQLAAFGETDQESGIYRVQEIRHQRDLVASILLKNEDLAVADADTGTIPDYDPNITNPPDAFTLAPRDLRVQEVTIGFGLNARAYARLSWQAPRLRNVRLYEIEMQEDFGDFVRAPVGSVPAPQTTTDVPLASPGTVVFRVRSIFSDGTASNWTTSSAVTITGGATNPPAMVQNFRATFISGRTHLTWDEVADERDVFYEVRKGGTPDSALTVGERLKQPPFQTVGDDTYWVAAVVITPFGESLYSTYWAELLIEDSVLIDNVVVFHDEAGEAWQGDTYGTVGIDIGANLVSTGIEYFMPFPEEAGTGDVVNAGGLTGGSYISPHVVDAGRVSRCRVSVDYIAAGVPADADFLGDPDFLNNPDFLDAALTRFIKVYPIIRVSATEYEADFGDWQRWSPDVYLGRLFQLGAVFELLEGGVEAGVMATLVQFSWTIDVPDRIDRYNDLTVPSGGLTILFEYGGYDATPSGEVTPFIGGPVGATVPHIMSTFFDAPDGHKVVIENVTASSVDVFVRDAADVNQGGSGVQILAQGY